MVLAFNSKSILSGQFLKKRSVAVLICSLFAVAPATSASAFVSPDVIVPLATAHGNAQFTDVRFGGRGHGGRGFGGGHGFAHGGHGFGGRRFGSRRGFRGRGYDYGGGYGVGAGLAGLAAGAVIGGAIASAAAAPAGDPVGYCESRFKSYNPATGMYLGYDGLHHPCP